MTAVLIYVTTASHDEAVRIAHAVVGERLAACANVMAPMTSVFRWEGAIQEESEVPLILKTEESLVGRLTERVKQLHSYQCPCVVALPVTGGNPAFLDWIVEETA
ncbi:MAG: divalent-cation tolerance protein CutA [Rhodospirillales bacterium]|nr:MAG: divalent-cation tolerance protein CutA [Rhodospirillales bacterium]